MFESRELYLSGESLGRVSRCEQKIGIYDEVLAKFDGLFEDAWDKMNKKIPKHVRLKDCAEASIHKTNAFDLSQNKKRHIWLNTAADLREGYSVLEVWTDEKIEVNWALEKKIPDGKVEETRIYIPRLDTRRGGPPIFIENRNFYWKLTRGEHEELPDLISKFILKSRKISEKEPVYTRTEISCVSADDQVETTIEIPHGWAKKSVFVPPEKVANILNPDYLRTKVMGVIDDLGPYKTMDRHFTLK